jgi:endonuclease-3 related protein
LIQASEEPLLVFDRLLERYGPQHWWPADDAFEMAVGAILTQHTSWKNVEKAIARLKAVGQLSLSAIEATDPSELAVLTRSAGCSTVKAARLKSFASHVRNHYDGQLATMLAQGGAPLRRELLSISGIGPETADCIVLYGANQPKFVVDAYSRRLFDRLGLIPRPSYDDVQRFCEASLPPDARLFNEFHALIVRHSIVHCRVQPRCAGCPLADRCAAYRLAVH